MNNPLDTQVSPKKVQKIAPSQDPELLPVKERRKKNNFSEIWQQLVGPEHMQTGCNPHFCLAIFEPPNLTIAKLSSQDTKQDKQEGSSYPCTPGGRGSMTHGSGPEKEAAM